jgi:enterochelin esterase family protein
LITQNGNPDKAMTDIYSRMLAFALAFSLCAAAQPVQPPRKNTYRANAGGATAAPRLVSPEVHPGRTITFRVRAPKASEVALSFPGSPRPMTKDGDGVWSVTIGPVAPEVYEYAFTVDGVRVPDTANSEVATGKGLPGSIVDVPATPPRFDQVQDVPHGALEIRSYPSRALARRRQMYVYLPPQYDSDPSRRFPVLYLRHGGGDDESTWSGLGRAGVILENLLAKRSAVPMLIVMTNGDTDGSWAGGSSAEGIELLGKELLGDVIPLVEKTYRVLPGAENRAITGLSMGGGQAFTIGIKHLDTFAWVGEFSSGLISEVGFDLTKHLPGFLDHPAEVNQQLHLLFLSCGTEDPRYPGQLDLMDALKSRGIRYEWYPTPGAHEWKVWRHALADFMPRLFTAAASK